MAEAGLDGDWLNGRHVWALTSGVDVCQPLADGLIDLGAQLQSTRGALGSQQEADEAVRVLAAEGGPPELVVLSVLPEAAMRCAPLSELSAEDWQAGAVDGVRAMLYLLRALGPQMKEHGGAIVMVGPSLSLVGCPQLVALSTVLEGQRGLMKSTARQWGGSGVTLNWVAVAPRILSPLFATAPLAAKPDRVSVALGSPLDLRGQVAPILGFLASPGGRAMTGATLTLDGGEWMVP